MENRSLTVHKTLPGGVGDGESGWAVLEKKNNNKSHLGKLYVLCIISVLILLIF